MIETRREGDVAVLRLARPPVNALHTAMVDELSQTVAAAACNPEIAALVLTGSSNVFCGGLDTKIVPAYSEDQHNELLRAINRMVLTLYACAKPFVAAVSGHAIGAGVVLALVCDVRFVASGNVRLGLTEAAAGIPFPEAPLAVLKAELSAPHARRYMLRAHTITPEEALSVGIADEIVSPSDLVRVACDEAARLAGLPAYRPERNRVRRCTSVKPNPLRGCRL